jgi:hypothetical protein
VSTRPIRLIARRGATRGLALPVALTLPAALAAVVAVAALAAAPGCGDENRPPVIEEFDGSPPFGDAPLDVRLFWKISDPDGDALTCRIDLDGDGEADHTISNCTSEDVHSYVIEEPGRHHATLTVSDGEDRVSRTIELYSNRCVFREETVWPERDESFGGATLSENEVELLFHSVADAPVISSGDILWGTSQGGYLRKVTAVFFEVSVMGKRYVLQTEPAHLEEAVETCQFGIRDYQMRFTGAHCTEDCEDLETIEPMRPDGPGVKGGVTIGHTFEFGKIPLGPGADFKPKLGLSITIDRAYLDVSFMNLKEFTFEATPKLTFMGHVEVEIASASWDREWPLAGPIYMAAVPIGPLVFTPVVNFTAAANLSLEPTLKLKFNAGLEATAGVTYKKGEGTTAWGNLSTFGNFTDPDLDLGLGSAQLGIKKRTSFLMFGVVGPYTGGHVYVKGALTYGVDDQDLCLKGQVRADSLYGLHVELFLADLFVEGSDNLAYLTFYNECLHLDGCGNGVCDPSEDCATCPDDCQECPPDCGNGTLDPGEECDPPASCPEDPEDCPQNDPCTEYTVAGSAAECTARCEPTAITSCTDDDGCCPGSCDSGNDNDCSPGCGNGVIDAGETCDPPSTCPTSCGDGDPCTQDSLIGSAANCNAECQHGAILSCAGGDGCCPAGCDSGNDADCSAVCGNGVQDAGETCDPPSSCPTSCPDPNPDPCIEGRLIGDANNCTAECTSRTITSCAGGDLCCPSGCNAANDGDCSPVCGNGICEPGEACNTTGECVGDCNCSTDPCSGYAGYYCGASAQFPGGTANYLYHCSNNVTQSLQYCTYGCVVAPPGSPDECASGGTLGDYGDACTTGSDCASGYCTGGYCCETGGGGAPDDPCGSGNDCCSGHCQMGRCCWNPDPPGCII